MNRNELAASIYRASHLTGEFVLRSGATSTEYFDKYQFESRPALLRQIATMLAPMVPPGTQALGGLELGGVPVASLLSQVTGLPTAFVRKKAKAYGTCRLAEGAEIAGRSVAVVEDVVSSGGQIIESVGELRARGAIITHALCVIDRESGGDARLRDSGITLVPLFRASELESAAA